MRKFASVILAVSVLVSSSALAAPKSAEAPQSAAMSQEKAQAAVLGRYPGAHIVSSKMQNVKGNSVWVVTFTRTGGNVGEKVMVDAQTGKVSKM